MKTLYLDLFSGISGDMFIGALLDLGVEPAVLERELRELHLDGYHLHVQRRKKSSIEGVKFDVHLAHEHAAAHEESAEDHGDHRHSHPHVHSHAHEHHHDHGLTHEHGHEHEHDHGHSHHTPDEAHHHDQEEHEHEHGRSYRQIRELIQQSGLSPWVKEKSLAVFRRVAVAEGKIHGIPTDDVGFHEVGAIDSIVDIVGACIALEQLGKPRVAAGPVQEGSGFVRCAHGHFPIPTPATLAILAERQIPLTQCAEPNELITPTGAALLAEFAESFGPMQNVTPERVGYGLGTRDNQTRPNVLRAVLGRSTAGETTHDWETDTIEVLESNIDDVNPEVLGNFIEVALASGALDVFYSPVQMKKNRPGVLVTVLCQSADADKFCELMLTHTTAFGVRRATTNRRKLRRDFTIAHTAFGDVRVKLGLLNGKTVQVAPEYESCKQVSAQRGVPVKEVYAAAIQSLTQSHGNR